MNCGCVLHEAKKSLDRPFEWKALDKLEKSYSAELTKVWDSFTKTALDILGVKAPKPTFSGKQESELMKAVERFLAKVKREQVIITHYRGAYELGTIEASLKVGGASPKINLHKNSQIYTKLADEGFSLVKDSATRAIIDRIIPEMKTHVIAGTNPVHVAKRLQELFGNQNSNWERLARSEMTMAAEGAKLDEWEEWGVRMVHFSPSPDACVTVCKPLRGDYPTGRAPIPVKSTHPNCRCSISLAKSEL